MKGSDYHRRRAEIYERSAKRFLWIVIVLSAYWVLGVGALLYAEFCR